MMDRVEELLMAILEIDSPALEDEIYSKAKGIFYLMIVEESLKHDISFEEALTSIQLRYLFEKQR